MLALKELVRQSPHPTNIDRWDYVDLIFGDSVLMVTDSLNEDHTQIYRPKGLLLDSVLEVNFFWPLPVHPNKGTASNVINNHDQNVRIWSHVLAIFNEGVDLVSLQKLVLSGDLPVVSVVASPASGAQVLLRVEAQSREEWEVQTDKIWKVFNDHGLSALEKRFQSMAILPGYDHTRPFGLVYLNDRLAMR